MSKTIIFEGCRPWNYYLIDMFFGEPYETNEEEFFVMVGFNRNVVPMHYDKDNINRQNFFLDGTLIGYRIRQ